MFYSILFAQDCFIRQPSLSGPILSSSPLPAPSQPPQPLTFLSWLSPPPMNPYSLPLPTSSSILPYSPTLTPSSCGSSSSLPPTFATAQCSTDGNLMKLAKKWSSRRLVASLTAFTAHTAFCSSGSESCGNLEKVNFSNRDAWIWNGHFQMACIMFSWVKVLHPQNSPVLD